MSKLKKRENRSQVNFIKNNENVFSKILTTLYN